MSLDRLLALADRAITVAERYVSAVEKQAAALEALRPANAPQDAAAIAGNAARTPAPSVSTRETALPTTEAPQAEQAAPAAPAPVEPSSAAEKAADAPQAERVTPQAEPTQAPAPEAAPVPSDPVPPVSDGGSGVRQAEQAEPIPDSPSAFADRMLAILHGSTKTRDELRAIQARLLADFGEARALAMPRAKWGPFLVALQAELAK